jgi:hypothetical protein
MLDLLLALDPWSIPAHMRLFFVGMALLGLAGALEKLARQRWGVVLGVPIGRFDEDYPGTIENPRAVDLDPHLYDVGRVEWVTDSRVLLLPLDGDVDMHASTGSRRTSTSMGFMCVGDLQIDAPPGSIRFRTRVLLRVVPLLLALLFVVGPYVPDPWGMGWPLPGTGRSLMLSIWPLGLFGGFFVYTAFKARTGVITAHHAVTGAFMATLRPAATTGPEP